MTSPYQGPRLIYTRDKPKRYDYDDYLADSADLEAEVVGSVVSLTDPYLKPRLTQSDYVDALDNIYDLIEDARNDLADITRDFLDSERFYNSGEPTETRNEFAIDRILGPDGRPAIVDDRSDIRRPVYERVALNLPGYDPDWFEEAMRPSRDRLSERDAGDGALYDFTARALKEVENAARTTSLWAVEDDPKTIRWARVAGNENIGSCGFCAMMISRGPVYTTQAKAQGRRLPTTREIMNAKAQGISLPPSELMLKYHPNCDCKVVPVWDESNWPGRDEYLKMQDLWYEVTSDYDGYEKFRQWRRYFEKNNPVRRRDDTRRAA